MYALVVFMTFSLINPFFVQAFFRRFQGRFVSVVQPTIIRFIHH